MISSIKLFAQRYFKYSHLKIDLQGHSKPFCELAALMAENEDNVEDTDELNAALRKLLEAKDCYVRAFLK